MSERPLSRNKYRDYPVDFRSSICLPQLWFNFFLIIRAGDYYLKFYISQHISVKFFQNKNLGETNKKKTAQIWTRKISVSGRSGE